MKMPKVFVDVADIPKVSRGKKGVDWKKILGEIPVGKVWKLTEDNKEYNLGSVKAGVNVINKEAKKQLYKAEQRTIDDKVTLFVTRLIPEKAKE